MSSQPDEQGIREAIAHYVEGMRTHAVATMKQGFHEQAILCGYLGDHLIAGPIAELYAWASANPSPAVAGERFDCEILSIGVTGRVAIAAVRETGHDGAVIDDFHLLKVEGRWWIVSKLWDTEP